MSDLLDRVPGALVYFVVVLFGLGVVLPAGWMVIGRLWWWAWLGRGLHGNTRVSRSLSSYAETDVRLLIQRWELRLNAPRPLAILFAAIRRLMEIGPMTRDLRQMDREREIRMHRDAIENLNEGWRSGLPPKILQEYMEIIEETSRHVVDPCDQLRGLCAVANVRYLTGDLKRGNRLATVNWRFAHEHEPPEAWKLKWMASYAFFNSTLFLGGIEKAMDDMADLWRCHYAEDQRKSEIVRSLRGALTVNPVLSVPRHMILAQAYREKPALGSTFWPSARAFTKAAQSDSTELSWLQAWYDEAQELCVDDVISRDFSHAYASFYAILLREGAMAKGALDAILDDSPLVSRYAKWGTYGFYELVLQDNPDGALKCFRRAAEFSTVSGNRFLDCFFACGHAVAATHSKSYLRPEADYYLKNAKRASRAIGSSFYRGIWEAAAAEVSRIRGDGVKATRHELRALETCAPRRILTLFWKKVKAAPPPSPR